MSDDSQGSGVTISFKDTLNLPTTDFPIRPNAAIDDIAMVERWEQKRLFAESFIAHEGNERFILHDGPPYANGSIHIGHAYNKILKDIIGKSQRMMGKQVPITPGWDCHGLPIEFKVAQDNPGLSRKELKKKCRAYAQGWIDVQKKEFKRLGILMNWDHPYITMSNGYQASILQAFGIFVDKGYIERKNKTVPWCPTCQTVLAIAEIEYAERKDPSVYVRFTLDQSIVDTIFPVLAGKEVSLLVWTTTPWTLPLNRAVMMKPGAEYTVLNHEGTYIVVGSALVDKICEQLSLTKAIAATISADELIKKGAKVHHPLLREYQVPIVLDANVQLDEGTASVHCAPGAGPQDYEVGVKNNLDIFSPVGPDGRYTAEVQIPELVGMPVSEGQFWVLKKLAELGTLFFKNNIKHSYPHCWRCRNGLIFRATKQWFCDLSQEDLKERSLSAIDGIYMLPEKSNNRLKSTIEGRLEWCLSRQRVWGVPIPAFICTACDYTYINKALIDSVAEHVAQEGIEYWDDVTEQTLLPKDMKCPSCNVSAWKKEEDILDVWFDSGISHYAVLQKFDQLQFPADMYLEGRDQHRGWFQSSLLTAMVIDGKAPMKTIITHGYTVDEQGRKMSKSLGNVVSPQEMIDKLGTDGLRMWASSIDCSGDVVVSAKLIANIQEVFRKIRNTSRFLLANLYDFSIETDAVPLQELQLMDLRALQELYIINDDVINAYKAYDFTAVFHKLGDYCATSLSSLYLDMIKDRLYVELSNGKLRRSAQTVCYYILDTLTRLIAPVLSFTAEQITDHYQKDKNRSIHLQEFASGNWMCEQSVAPQKSIYRMLDEDLKSELTAQLAVWSEMIQLRSVILKAIEEQRAINVIKHSLEASVKLYVDPNSQLAATLERISAQLAKTGESLQSLLKEMLIVSQIEIISEQRDLAPTSHTGVFVQVGRMLGNKCPRCWQWHYEKHEHNLCDRCYKIVNSGR